MSLGSLTTIFSPAPTCIGPDQFWLEERDGQSYVQQGSPFTQAPECFPSGFTPVPASYYLPGVCPSGYTAACLTKLSGNGGKIKQNICCPNVGEYFYPSESATEYGEQPWLSTFGCWSGIISAATVAVTQNSITTTLVLSTGVIGAYAVNVRSEYINDGLPEETGSLSQHQPAIAAPAISKARGWDHGRISAGTAAGIGVGAGIGVILLAAGIFVIMRRIRARHQAPRQHYVDTGDPPVFVTWKSFELGKPELHGNQPMCATMELPSTHGQRLKAPMNDYLRDNAASLESPTIPPSLLRGLQGVNVL
ncbi:hypothetical protein CKAH01_12683 [Colletotrichum kahawae]|uniref:LPXTG-domain-containing protein n=1 Tax=Colletotrichum kahawae TaxID=34407 RepID=A0AAD9YQD2_COLKA|nr:hypothetical protein CKAH01_12683 [Colletotrichum kahawae]